MTLDPYAVLGIAPGASMAEVKRAYRRMAKAFHPDSAGEAAVPKFLAIHEAYEAIVAGRPMRQTSGSSRRTAAGWAADPARARHGRASRSAGAANPSGGPTGDTAGPSRRKPGPRPPGDGSTRKRSTRKATLGSTSYDDAVQEPFEPEWEGASWYGRASGTYWTINPKEYADPRKHGPEYQERARRAARAGAGDASAGSETWSEAADGSSSGADPGAASDPELARQQAAESARRRARFDAAAPDRTAASAAADRRVEGDAADRSRSHDRSAQPPGVRLEGWLRALFGARDVRTRLVLAAVGWPPLGVIAASVISQLTGCASFSAACEPPDDLLPLAAGAVLYALLVAIPMLARLSAAGTIAILVTAIPVAAFVVRPEASPGTAADAALALAILLLAWLVGMIAVLVASRGRILHA